MVLFINSKTNLKKLLPILVEHWLIKNAIYNMASHLRGWTFLFTHCCLWKEARLSSLSLYTWQQFPLMLTVVKALSEFVCSSTFLLGNICVGRLEEKKGGIPFKYSSSSSKWFRKPYQSNGWHSSFLTCKYNRKSSWPHKHSHTRHKVTIVD